MKNGAGTASLTAKLMTLLLILCLLPCAALGDGEAPRAELTDNLVETKHSIEIGGKQIDYTATTGTIALESDLGQYEVFFTAYTVDSAGSPAYRPVTFAFNGGPGSASLWLHMGLLGPERIALSEEGKIDKIPVGTEPNKYCVLDLTDLVFIDPVGTGYSRALPGTDEKTFFSYENDIQSVGDFIRLYTSRYGRWASPKYVAGESYGTTRAIGLCDYLRSAHKLALNGIMLVSSINDFASVETTAGNELPYVNFLPSFAAAAWYHKKADGKYLAMELDDYLEEVKAYAAGDYLSLLYRGSRISAEEREAAAEKIAAYIGVSKEFVLKHNLRVERDDFNAELLSDRKLMIGRIDSRYTGPVVDGNLGDGTSDPSSLGINEAFSGVFNQYVSQVLNYRTDQPYDVLSLDVNSAWSFGSDNRALAQEDMIRDCMSANEQMKVWVLCGRYDLATPFFAAEWVYSHLFLNDELQDNLSFTYYPSGHMFYLHEPSMVQFRKDAEAWYGN